MGDELYTYDLIGNMTSKTGVGSYGYSAAHPHAVTSSGPFGFGYDANGNMTSVGGQITLGRREPPNQHPARQRQGDVLPTRRR